MVSPVVLLIPMAAFAQEVYTVGVCARVSVPTVRAVVPSSAVRSRVSVPVIRARVEVED